MSIMSMPTYLPILLVEQYKRWLQKEETLRNTEKKKGCMAIPEEERQSIYETQACTSSEETKQSEALVAFPSFTLYYSTDRGPYMSARQASNFITFPPLV